MSGSISLCDINSRGYCLALPSFNTMFLMPQSSFKRKPIVIEASQHYIWQVITVYCLHLQGAGNGLVIHLELFVLIS